MTKEPQLFVILKKEHKEVDAMLTELAGDDVAMRQRVYPRLKSNLLAHAKSEEKTFYPELQKAGEKEDARHAKHEHKEIEAALMKVDGLDYDDDGWVEAVEELTACVQHHVEEEESEVFDAARESLDEAKLDEIAERFQAQKQELLLEFGGEAGDGFEELTKDELMEEARERDLPGRSSMTKDELISNLRGSGAS